jgi:GAF domain-containing protein
MSSNDSARAVSHRASSEQQSLFLPQIVDLAVALTRADKGNIQLLDPQTGNLVFAASRGFDGRYLEYFASVSPAPDTACGKALATRERVIVEDVPGSEIFAGKPALDVMLAEEVFAVHSMPIVSRSGRIWGVVSTHWKRQHPETDYDPALLDVLAEQTAEFLEQDAAERPQSG